MPTNSASSLKTLFLFGGMMLLGTLVLVWLGTPRGTPVIGQLLPPLDLQPLVNSDSAPTTESLVGKVTVLHFWGTWCPPCRDEFPGFVKLAKKFENEPRVAIVSVSCSGGPEYNLAELKSETEAYLTDVAPGMPTFCDPAAMTRAQIAMLLSGGTIGYPTTMLADSEGRIVEVLAGYREGDMEKLQTRIEAMMK
ncbi:MAG: TlpA disulfide reductase family protein [Pirellulaceae bacterium]|nr:TlpA disulfide reductase family protein [Pirellulaceae bacterium]